MKKDIEEARLRIEAKLSKLGLLHDNLTKKLKQLKALKNEHCDMNARLLCGPTMEDKVFLDPNVAEAAKAAAVVVLESDIEQIVDEFKNL